MEVLCRDAYLQEGIPLNPVIIANVMMIAGRKMDVDTAGLAGE